jgi:hypothetical protein
MRNRDSKTCSFYEQCAKVRFFSTKHHIELLFFIFIYFFSEIMQEKRSFFTNFAPFLCETTEKLENINKKIACLFRC